VIRTALVQSVSGVLRIVSFLLLVWWFVTLPVAVSGIVIDLTTWQGFLTHYASEWNSSLYEIVSSIPIVTTLPIWVLDALYLAIMLILIGGYYWLAVVAEVNRQVDLAMRSVIDPVEPYNSLGHADTIAALAIIANEYGAESLAGIPVWLAAKIGETWLRSRAPENQKAIEHADAETRRIETARLARAIDMVEAFRKRETANFIMAGMLGLAIAALSYGASPLSELLMHR
jgi:hypothetical protein